MSVTCLLHVCNNALQAVTRDPDVFAAGVSGAGIFNWISELRYYTDTGGSTYHLDVQPPLPAGWRALTTGPLPHLAGPGWAGLVHTRLETAFGSSPAAYASAKTAPLLLIQGDGTYVTRGSYVTLHALHASNTCVACRPPSLEAWSLKA